MRSKTITAEIRPIPKSNYLGKLFLRKMTVNDPINSCHVFIPQPTDKYPDINIQIWFRNGAGRTLMRFKSPNALATFLRNVADQVTSDECLDTWQRLEDSCE